MDKLWLIGAGSIAKEYAKVLNALGKEFIVVGRGKKNADLFYDEIGVHPVVGGLENYLRDNSPETPNMAIVAVNVQYLAETTIALMRYGVKKILCEKPGFNDPSELDEVFAVANSTRSQVYYAYNRRFFASVFKAEEIIKEDGGLTSMNFEFTEWGHIIEDSDTPDVVKRHWLTANSSHVIDLAFFLGGKPQEISSYTAGKLTWHKPSRFVGAGVTKKGILFNYQANWEAPGRWALEFQTPFHRIYLKPMELLQLQDKGSVKVYPVEIDDCLDKEFKPGFYLETKAFLEGETTRLCSIEEQVNNTKEIFQKIQKT